jgi:hypothetical protein
MPIKKKEVVKKVVKKVMKTLKTEDYPDILIMNDKVLVRTYSKEVHGDEYMLLAEGFLSKYPNYTSQHGA